MKKSLFLIIFLFATSLFAHECFILAYKFKLLKGDNLELHLFIADGLNIQLEKTLQKSITEKFDLITENGKTDLLKNSDENKLPVTNLKVNFEGLGLLVMERKPVQIKFTNDKFLEYLKEDHIENIKIDPSKTEQRETYTRFIKSLVQSNYEKNDNLFGKIIGEKFEIVLLQNPYLLKKGDNLTVKILFNGKPLANKIITARNRIGNKPSIVEQSRTNLEGICSFKLKREGDWLIHATHMIPCNDKKIADWESFWATYTFGL